MLGLLDTLRRMPKDGRTFRHASLYLSVALAIGFVSYQSSGSVLIAIAVGLLSGLGVTYVLLRLDRQANRRLSALDLPDGEYSPRIHATAFVKGPPEEVFIACERAIQRLPNFGKVTRRLDGRRIGARTRWSTQSWGERIDVQIVSAAPGTTLRVSSVPILWTVTVDMRMNFQNVALLMRDLSRSFTVRDVQPSGLFDEVLAAK